MKIQEINNNFSQKHWGRFETAEKVTLFKAAKIFNQYTDNKRI
jgi:predicted secreted acid phosphatase